MTEKDNQGTLLAKYSVGILASVLFMYLYRPPLLPIKPALLIARHQQWTCLTGTFNIVPPFGSAYRATKNKYCISFLPTYKFMLFSRKSHSLLLLKRFWLTVSVTWRSIARCLTAYLRRPSSDFAIFFAEVYSRLFSTILVYPRGSSGHALITRSLRKTQEVNQKRGCYALLTAGKNLGGMS